MKPFPLLVSLLAFIYSCIKAELTPSDIQLSWLTNTSMEVNFIGNTTDTLLLTPTSNIPDMETPCLFAGKLQGDPGSVVAVSGCMESNETSVSISSILLPGGLMDVLLVDGVTYDIKDGSETSFIGIEDDVLYTSSRKKRQVPAGTDDDFLIPPANPNPVAAAFSGPLPKRVILQTDIKYDNSLLEHFGGSHSKTKQWISRVVELTKPRMAHRSLTMPITIQVGQMDHTNAVLEANGENIRSLRPRKLTSYFCKDIGGGVVGVAYLGTACRNDGYAANINEMWTTSNTELRTAKVFAHELGHNLKMEHDFASKHGGSNGPCNGKGLMSYGSPPDQWSECSNVDYTEWWRQEGFSCVKAAASATCPPGWGNSSPGGKCYKFVNGRGSWMETERSCQAAGSKLKWPGGASLATIGSSSEQAAVMAAMEGVDPKKHAQVYIGGFSRFYSGKKNWYWIDGTPFKYDNFESNLVDTGNEDCLAFINRPWSGTQRGEWNDVPCNSGLWAWICSAKAK